jgi:uncharacterized protein
MGDLSNEPSMEDILSSIKRIIAEEGDGASPRGRRIGRQAPPPVEADPSDDDEAAEVLELDQPVAPREPEMRAPQPERAQPRPEPRPASFAAAPSDAEMLSPRAAEATRGQLEALSRLIVKPDVAGSDTLEGMVRDMLKPMLSQWLDANLPRIVEAMVAREIARISGRRDD